jgi:hypothetical protein
MESGTLEIGHADAVHSHLELYLPLLLDHRMLLIVVDDNLVVDVKDRPIVGGQSEAVCPGLGDPESAGVVDREPLKSPGDAGKAFVKGSCGDAQGGGIDCADGLQLGKVRELPAAGFDGIDFAAKAAIGCDGSAERVQRFSNYSCVEFVRGWAPRLSVSVRIKAAPEIVGTKGISSLQELLRPP